MARGAVERTIPVPAVGEAKLDRSDSAVRRNGDVTPRRLLGAFYTPDDLATVLTRWALEDGPGTVLDPSYGGCAFLRAAVNVLSEHSAPRPDKLVFGVDVDPKCVDYARDLVAHKNHITADFFALRPEQVAGAPFKAIVGNPPYVRHHWLKGSRRRAAHASAEQAGHSIQGTASTWAYFVVHALAFLAKDGRLALLVPEAILQADYSKAVRELLQKRFARVLLVHVRDRIFTDTDEPVVVIAAEGSGPGTIRVEAIERASELPAILKARAAPTSKQRTIISNGRDLPSDVHDLVVELARSENVTSLGDLATIRIGFVTGSNHFFIRSRHDREEGDIPARASVPVVARTQWLTGLAFTEKDHRHLTELGRRTLLIRPTEAFPKNKGVREWIAKGTAEDVHHRHKCAVREPWYRVNVGGLPDAFATCSRLGSPLLVINSAGYRCSNTLHAVTWKKPAKLPPKAIAVCFLSSLASVWAEIYGRRYGGGVLKLEPGTIRGVPIPLLKEAADVFAEIDSLLRRNKENEARAVADDAVLRKGLALSEQDISRLQRARVDLKQQRLPARTRGSDA